MNDTLAINAGPIRYETRLGPLFLDGLFDDATIDLIISEMARRKLVPFDIHGATIRNGVVDFDLREPLSSD